MRRVLTVIAALAALTVAGCSGVHPKDGCLHHHGVKSIGTDATNSRIPVTCNDGYIVIVEM